MGPGADTRQTVYSLTEALKAFANAAAKSVSAPETWTHIITFPVTAVFCVLHQGSPACPQGHSSPVLRPCKGTFRPPGFVTPDTYIT
jgi:hypothetical protein